MRNIKGILLATIFLAVQTVYGQTVQSSIAEELKAMNNRLTTAEHIHFTSKTTVRNLSDGSSETFHSSFSRKGNQFFTAQNSNITIQNKEVLMSMDSASRQIVLAKTQQINLPIQTDFERSLSWCTSSSMKDSAGFKNIYLDFEDKNLLTEYIRIVLKDNLPVRIEMLMKDGVDRVKTTIEFGKMSMKDKVPDSLFRTDKYVKVYGSSASLAKPYQNYQLFNLLKK